MFNLSVGSAGLLSLGILGLIARLPPHPGGSPVPWVGVLVYAVLANLCYTLGPVGDLALRRVLGDRAAGRTRLAGELALLGRRSRRG